MTKPTHPNKLGQPFPPSLAKIDQVNTLKKKLGRGSPIHDDFLFAPSPFPKPTKSGVKTEKTEEVGGVL